MKIKTLACLMGCAISSMAAAEKKGVSASVSIGQWSYEEDNLSLDFAPNSIEFRFAKEINNNLDVVGNFGLGLGDSETFVNSSSIAISIKNYIGVYLRPNVDIGNSSAYVLLGLARTALEAEGRISGSTVSSASTSDSGLSYGLGFSLGFTDSSSLALEYRMQTDADTYDLSGFTVGYQHKF
jgi:opacity protein-like surface antigen